MSTVDNQFRESERNSRTLQYANRVMDPAVKILISGDQGFLESNAGQQALITAVNLIARMTSNISLDIPKVENQFAKIAPGSTIDDAMADFALAINPAIQIDRNAEEQAYQFHLGQGVHDMNVVGGSWVGHFGYAVPRPERTTSIIGFGACAAVCGAVAHMFSSNFGSSPKCTAVDLFARQIGPETTNRKKHEKDPVTLGNIWLLGCGSIGSSALYFLSLGPAKSIIRLIDGDVLKNHNLDRGACFMARDLGEYKVRACENFLRNCSHVQVLTDPKFLHESSLWESRSPQEVDVVISAANEYDIRTRIENAFPPIQVYATTGSYWQATVWCHIPLVTACSLCAFPPGTVQSSLRCSEGDRNFAELAAPDSTENDASLPFLSFLGGLLTAAELYRLAIGDKPPPRYDVWTAKQLEFHHVDIPIIAGCMCQNRSQLTHRAVIGDTRYAHLSTI